MDDTSGGRTGRTDKQIRPAKETMTDELLKPKPKKVRKLKNQLREDFQLDMTNWYVSFDNKTQNKEKIYSNTSKDKLATENANIDKDTTTIRIPK
ncbi:hypothetical protein PR048_008463 [Dryococelus australis]|uniref:Uncharacterized protein n=1 Tax=Dryococelus australis TaxID=614101 RepID=A0ABQ9HXZ3_9NEOP|nr:hypothetical protein PR048_008463 [Dryococelus australis]